MADFSFFAASQQIPPELQAAYAQLNEAQAKYLEAYQGVWTAFLKQFEEMKKQQEAAQQQCAAKQPPCQADAAGNTSA